MKPIFKPLYSKSSIKTEKLPTGETLETKVCRILSNKEQIKDGAQPLYTERKDGVLPQTNIRTDRFEIAADAMNKVEKSIVAKREAAMHIVKDDSDTAEPIQGTNTNN